MFAQANCSQTFKKIFSHPAFASDEREREREYVRVREREKTQRNSVRDYQRVGGVKRGKTERENWKNTNMRHWKHEKWKE